MRGGASRCWEGESPSDSSGGWGVGGCFEALAVFQVLF